MTKRIFLTSVAVVMLCGVAWSMTPDERKQYREKLMQITPTVPTFNEWVAATDALPPDFDALPRINSLPDPFVFLDGKRTVKTKEDWKERRAEIIDLMIKYQLGRIPPKPKLDQIIEITPEQAAAEGAARGAGRGAGFGRRGAGPASGPATAPDAVADANAPATAPAGRGRAGGAGRGRGGAGPAPGSITKIVDLKYGPNSAITQRVTVTIPPGAGPFPVLIGGGANITSRGYISCSAPSNVDSPPAIGEYYPDYDWGSMAKCAWTTQMVVDYLYTLPQVDKNCIAITGYSRGGKYAAISAMLDERITACLALSTGVGGVLPWRSASERGAGEGIETTTRNFPIWFTKQLRFFTGREDRLPIDGNLIAAAIAPRAVLNLYGISDEVAHTHGNEESYFSAQKVFDLLGVPDRNSILCISEGNRHHGANDANATMNWLDIQFGKSTAKWENKSLYPWNYKKWQADSKNAVDLSKFPAKGSAIASATSKEDWEKKIPDIRKSVEWMLGTKEGGTGGPDPAQTGREDVIDWAITRASSFGWYDQQKAAQIEYRSITMGEGTRVELYTPKNIPAGTKLPTVIWLHGFSYPMGYMWVYRQRPDIHPILGLASEGYAVIGFDQTGHGGRTAEWATFFDRFPQWSRMGRMVADTRAAIDAAQKEAVCDPEKIYLFGYSMGGMVALHTAALDPRVKGVVSICGFTPMRVDTAAKGVGGLARYSVDLPLMPRLGAFIGKESQVPYDYNELIAAVAPRPVYILQPQLDRDATPADVRGAVDEARKVYGFYNATDKLVLNEPWDYNRLPQATQDSIIAWMKQTLK